MWHEWFSLSVIKWKGSLHWYLSSYAKWKVWSEDEHGVSTKPGTFLCSLRLLVWSSQINNAVGWHGYLIVRRSLVRILGSFMWSLHACVGSLWVLQRPPTSDAEVSWSLYIACRCELLVMSWRWKWARCSLLCTEAVLVVSYNNPIIWHESGPISNVMFLWSSHCIVPWRMLQYVYMYNIVKAFW